MSDDIVLKASKRDQLGRKVKELRRNGDIPAVVHDHGKDSIHISVPELELKKAYRSAGKHAPIQLDVDGKKYTTLIKEVVHQPATANIFHTVFQAVSANEKVTAEIPVQIVGEIPAEKASLLVLKSLETVVVESIPKDLPEVIEIDGAKLAEVGDKLHVSDLAVPENVIIKTSPETAIATVEMPKDQVAEADAALAEQEAAEGAEPEVEGEETPEEGKDDSDEGDAKDAKSEEE